MQVKSEKRLEECIQEIKDKSVINAQLTRMHLKQGDSDNLNFWLCTSGTPRTPPPPATTSTMVENVSQTHYSILWRLEASWDYFSSSPDSVMDQRFDVGKITLPLKTSLALVQGGSQTLHERITWGFCWSKSEDSLLRSIETGSPDRGICFWLPGKSGIWNALTTWSLKLLLLMITFYDLVFSLSKLRVSFFKKNFFFLKLRISKATTSLFDGLGVTANINILRIFSFAWREGRKMDKYSKPQLPFLNTTFNKWALWCQLLKLYLPEKNALYPVCLPYQ